MKKLLKINSVFEYSTLAKPRVIAPLINLHKDDIVKLALERDVPLEFVRSCYNNAKKNCGKCESCKSLKTALKNNNQTKLVESLFDDEN